MSIVDTVFKKYVPNFKKLIKYGFKKDQNKYLYEKLFNNNEFKIIIEITSNGEIISKVIDIESNDEFLPLKVETQQGAFVNKIREECQNILTDIRDNCFSKNYFMFSQANRITNLIINKYGDAPDFMWDKFPNYGVFKNSDSSKWYGLIGNIDSSKLGIDDNKQIEIMNLKLDKDEIQELLKKDGFFPAWHMNKKSWITIALDDTLPDNEIMTLIDESYSYTVKPSKKRPK